MANSLTVGWSKLKRFEEIWDSPIAMNYYGVYTIFESGFRTSRPEYYKFGNRELIYCGIVWAENRSFAERMRDHKLEWGTWSDSLEFKFGVIHSDTAISKQTIEFIEGCFVLKYEPSENIAKKKSFTVPHNAPHLIIFNKDPADGLLTETIDTKTDFHWS